MALDIIIPSCFIFCEISGPHREIETSTIADLTLLNVCFKEMYSLIYFVFCTVITDHYYGLVSEIKKF